jgi:hypothetical protein
VLDGSAPKQQVVTLPSGCERRSRLRIAAQQNRARLAPAYCQIEIRITEAGHQPWQIRGSFGASMDDLR